MKLKDCNKSGVNPDMIPVINDSAMNLDRMELYLIFGDLKYSFRYDVEEDLREDYKKIKSLVDGK
jgi:hypothetical protein